MEIQTDLTNSHLSLHLGTFASTTDSEKAWHIFSLLLSLRRPARPTELASITTLFYTTPQLIEFLCFIPTSPLFLTPNYFVTFSSVGYLAISQFVANSDICLNLLPRFQLGLRLSSYGERQRSEGGQMVKKRKKFMMGNEKLQVGKRRAVSDDFDGKEDDKVVLRLPSVVSNASTQAYFSDGNMSRDITLQSFEPPAVAFDALELEKAMLRTSLLLDSSDELPKFNIGETGYGNEKVTDFFVNRDEVNYASRTGCQFDSLDSRGCQNFLPSISEHRVKAVPFSEMNHVAMLQSPFGSMEDNVNEESSFRKIRFTGTSRLQLYQETQHSQKEVVPVVDPCESGNEDIKFMQSNQEEPHRANDENCLIAMNKIDGLQEDKLLKNISEDCSSMIPSIEKEKVIKLPNSQATLTASGLSVGQNPLAKISHKSKTDQKQAPSQRLHSIDKTLENANAACSPLQKLQTRTDKKPIPMKQHMKYYGHQDMNVKEKKENLDKNREPSVNPSHEQGQQRVLPNFEPFIVEEEEGSGGYGTVYRARRKSDGVTFAIKCPHVNANRNHVHNELKMLERFGGKNFVIKYEGSFKNGDSDCLVLEHVEHDRPEVLKRDIDVCELQWYGYCMFRALAGLHKQGIVHRDVKPGNFLFNRKACKGYLIDFNLAMDLNQKYGTADKTKLSHDVSLNSVPLSRAISIPPSKSRKILTPKAVELANREQGKVLKPLLISKDTRKKIQNSNHCAEVGSRSAIKSQGADGSGITSAREATSTKTLSAEKFREPLPSQGRKELINLVQEALQGANRGSANVPVSKRKRIAATPAKVDRKFLYITPMPLHSAGGVVGGAGVLKNKGDGKNKREGPCVGTKGFRAPEVLFRSLHQGPKVDIWSAGVTLLYLLAGRTPFAGDPDQNVKEIAKLRGSEDLWEVAKLHGRESSFPAGLLDIKSLPSIKLQDWCKHNNRRPDFLEVIPGSFFDLVDKCLTVNPRLRISAEEALRHEFFTPCHEALRKHRLLRQEASLDSASSCVLLHEQSQKCAEVS
ncbi:uncharacterized protein [Coffea arabica]|uniref:non-specific serine/threonine protein kinase n=2 Tax=Coffea TaxID=13442 RepID=A0ABM4VB31_COFAR